MGEKEPRIEATGGASLHITESGQTVEANAPLGITVDDTCRWQGRPEHPPVESDSVDVRRFMRRAVHTLKPDPPQRPIRPVPKPVAKKGRASVPTASRCPLCNGEGWFGDHATTGATPCELCDGVGILSPTRAAEWLEDEHQTPSG